MDIGKEMIHRGHAANSIVPIFLPLGKLNTNEDFFTICSSESKQIDYLLFFDSRGSTLDHDKTYTFTSMLADYLTALNKSVLAICRPLEITVFFSLFNFLNSSSIKARNLITNMGFVDFTPKKSTVIDEMMEQKSILFKNIECKSVDLESYRLSSGKSELLKYMDISSCLDIFSDILSKRFINSYLLQTPQFEFYNSFPRERPRSFYTQLLKTNSFIERLSANSNSITAIHAPKVPQDYLGFSYDGVHFTKEGHHKVFLSVIEALFYEDP